MNRWLLILTVWFFTALGCQQEPHTAPAADSPVLSTADVKPIQEAVNLVNKILGDRVSVTLANDQEVLTEVDIPVYFTDGQTLSSPSAVYVETEYRRIIVGDGLIAKLPKMFSLPDYPRDDAEEMLALILLHEVGHIVNDVDGDFNPSERVSRRLLNTIQTESKDRELAADRFVAESINIAPPGASVDAMMLKMTISSISFDLMGTRIIGDWGNPYSRSDMGYSHPNMQLRFLILGYLINPTPEQLELLETFVAERNTPPPSILYDARDDEVP